MQNAQHTAWGRAAVQKSGKDTSLIVQSGYAARLAAAFLGKRRDARVLDVGCGGGAFLADLKRAGFSALCGVDYFDYGNAVCPTSRLDVSHEPLPWHGGSFDAVTAWELVEHLENPRFFIREAHRVLAHGGLLLVSLPNIFHVRSRMQFFLRGNFTRWTERNDHVWAFSRNIIAKTFAPYFRIREQRFHLVEIDQGSANSRILNRLTFLNRILPENQWFSHFVVYVFENMAASAPQTTHP